MRTDDCYQLGEVIKTHGLQGEVYIHLDVDFPEDYKELESVFIEINGKLVPFFIVSIQINGKKALVKFEEVDELDRASEILQARLFLPLTNLPKLEAGQFYYHQLIGSEVRENKELIGKVSSVYDLNNNHLLVVESDGKEILIPITDEIIKSVNIESGTIEVSLPDGLLDIYNE